MARQAVLLALVAFAAFAGVARAASSDIFDDGTDCHGCGEGGWWPGPGSQVQCIHTHTTLRPTTCRAVWMTMVGAEKNTLAAKQARYELLNPNLPCEKAKKKVPAGFTYCFVGNVFTPPSPPPPPEIPCKPGKFSSGGGYKTWAKGDTCFKLWNQVPDTSKAWWCTGGTSTKYTAKDRKNMCGKAEWEALNTGRMDCSTLPIASPGSQICLVAAIPNRRLPRPPPSPSPPAPYGGY